ncbi:hypothetical protein ACWF50_23875, partial [Brucella pseudogrignonensis]
MKNTVDSYTSNYIPEFRALTYASTLFATRNLRHSDSRRSVARLSRAISILMLFACGICAPSSEALADEVVDGYRTKIIDGTTPDSPWVVDGDLYIGQAGSGHISIINGGVVNDRNGYLGVVDGAGNSGRMSIDGVGSRWLTEGSVVIDTGVVYITNGGQVYTGGLVSLSHAGSSFLVDGAGSKWDFGEGTIESNGWLDISNGGVVSDKDSHMAILSGDKAEASLKGVGSTWLNTGEFLVGIGGYATVWADEGAAIISDGYSALGVAPHSGGDVRISDPGTRWTGSERLEIGIEGRGSLSIQYGGTVENVDASIAVRSGSYGSVHVWGYGSSWVNLGSLSVGESGVGNLRVLDGGVVSSGDSFVGRSIGGTGTVDIDGDGSKWLIGGGLSIGGYRAAGVLNVFNSGCVTVSRIDIAKYADGLGTVNIGGGAGEAPLPAGTIDADAIVFGSGTGFLNFNSTNELTLRSSVSGNGTINVLAGKTILTGYNSDFSGVTNVTGGTLEQGRDHSFSSLSTYLTMQAGTLDFGGFSTSIASLINDGSVDFGGTGGTTLHVIGNYSGNGAVTINSVLGG